MALRKLLNTVRNLLNFSVRHPWVKYGQDVHVQWSTRIWSPHKHVRIGSHVGIGDFCTINTDVEIGNHVLIGSNVGLLARDAHSPYVIGKTIYDAPRGDMYRIIIEDDVWIGFGAIILSGVRISRGSIIGAGALVTRDVAPYSIVLGSPSSAVRHRFTPDEVALHEQQIGVPRY